ncbi:MAG: protein-disulfide isomerase, partial [Yoonia sp.]
MRKLLMTAAVMSWPLGVAAQDLTDARIKELALQAIMENPQIIMEAVALLDQERNAQQAAVQAQTLAQQREVLENDPNAPFMGGADAGTVVVEFFDYNCPYCKRAATDVKALLAADSDVR